MSTFTDKHKELLAKAQDLGDTRLSLYLNLGAGDPTQAAQKLREATEEIRQEPPSLGESESGLEDLLEPLDSLAGDAEHSVWNTPGEALALFRSSDYFAALRLPERIDEGRIISKRFHLKPLLHFITRNKPFYILSLFQDDIALYQADRFHIEQESVFDLPKSLDESLDSVASDLTSELAEAEEGESKEDTQLRERLRQINNAVSLHLNGQLDPLFLVSDERTADFYRQVNTYPGYADSSLTRQRPLESERALLEETWPLVEEMHQSARDRAIKLVESGLQLGHVATASIVEAAKASQQSRIDTCLVAQDQQRWGRISDDEITLSDGNAPDGAPNPSSVDLLDYIACKTMQQGGRVFLAQAKEIPGESPIAVLLKY